MNFSPAGQSGHPPDSFCQQQGQPVVLIIDDDDDNLLLLSYAIAELGYQTVMGKSGRETLNLAKQHIPDLILLDIVLPDMSGVAVLHQLRQQSKTRHIPVVAVTALARRVDQAKIASAGFSGYLAKPYLLDDLEAITRRYID